MNGLTLEIHINLRQGGYPGLELRETVQMADITFMEMAGLLKQFHELAEKVKTAHQPR